MSLTALSASIILAIAPLLWLPVLPGLAQIQAMAATGALLAFFRYKPLRYSGFWLLFFAWGALAGLGTVWPMTHLTQGQQNAEVVITASDSASLHRAKIVRVNGRALWPAPGVNLYGNYLPQPGCAGQRWRMRLTLRPVHGQLNEGGFDTQRYALAQHTPLTGRFSHAEVLDARCSPRARYLSSLTSALASYPSGPVILGLGMGERLAVSAEIKDLMRETGTSHLMAISGLHIALAASAVWLLVRGGQFFLSPIGWAGEARWWPVFALPDFMPGLRGCSPPRYARWYRWRYAWRYSLRGGAGRPSRSCWSAWRRSCLSIRSRFYPTVCCSRPLPLRPLSSGISGCQPPGRAYPKRVGRL